jgi:hypothetical protein
MNGWCLTFMAEIQHHIYLLILNRCIMKKLTILVLALTFVMSSCNTSEELVKPTPVEDVADIQVGLEQLNDSYAQNLAGTRSFWGFLRKLTVCCADAAGFIFGGGIDASTKLSELADKYLPGGTKGAEIKASEPANGSSQLGEPATENWSPGIKDNSLSGLVPTEVGYIHNKFIIDKYSNGPIMSSAYDIEQQSLDDFLTPAQYVQYEGVVPADKLYASQDFSMQTARDVIEPIQNNVNISVQEYTEALTKKTNDVNIQNQLKITGKVLEGLQYVDDNDTTYITKARDIIKSSKVSAVTKDKLMDAISIANASAKLWITPSK